MATPQKKIAIIGAGCSGLTAIKSCLDEHLEPVCFERSADIGGLWRYSDQPLEGQACVMRSTVINTSKEMMSFSDFPIPAKYPMYMHNSQVLEYFRQYADHFGVKKYIRFSTSVLYVRKTEDFAVSGQWEIKTRDDKSGEETTEIFDGVLACTGHHAEKYMPDFPGLKDFKGTVTHSHDYRVPDVFDNKRVLVIGIGNSGGDIAVELSRRSKQVFLSTRKGTWILKRISEKGMPADYLFNNRVSMILRDYFPAMLDRRMRKRMNNIVDHDLYGLTPNYGPIAQHPMVNDDMPNRIVCGAIKIKTDIKRFTATGVEFIDGTSEEDIDCVILATGYSFGFPYIGKEIIDVEENRVQLYKYMYPPDLERPTLAVIGCFQPLGAIMPICELQCRLATRVIKGDAFLPPREDKWKDIRAKESAMAKTYVSSRRHTIQVDYPTFMDELAEMAGCKPDFYDLLRHDPKLALKVIFGPVVPYQFRLYGPHQWKGAREAIMTAKSRLTASLKTREVPKTKTLMVDQDWLFKLGMFIVVIFLLRFLFL